MNLHSYFTTRFCSDFNGAPFVPDPEDNDFISPIDSSLSELNYVDSHMRITDVLSIVLHSDSELERRKYLDLLTDQSSVSGSQFANLDDDTKIQLLKPRSAQSPAEMASYADYVQNFIDANNIPEPAPAPSPEPASEPAPASPPEPA